MVHKRTASALAFIMLVAAPLIVPAAAVAAPRFHAVLSIPNNRVDASAPFAITYSTTNVPGNARIYLQRQFGTGKVWKSVEKLHGLSGSMNARAVPIGKYLYRIEIAIGRSNATSAAKLLYAYGTVPFETVCAAMIGGGNCSAGTQQVGTTIFTYAAQFNSSLYPNYLQALSAKTTTCRSANLQFAPYNTSQSGSYETYVQFIQSASDPETASTGPNTIGTITATLDGGPWILNLSHGINNYTGGAVYFNGSFNCYSTTGS
jgi:hypothetical protein